VFTLKAWAITVFYRGVAHSAKQTSHYSSKLKSAITEINGKIVKGKLLTG
jgi:hypothetical protein